MSSLADKLRAARRIEVKIGDVTFFGMRATEEQYGRYVREKFSDADVCRAHIDGWEGVKESDIDPDGGKDLVKFNRDDFSEAIADNSVWAHEIVTQIIKVVTDRFTESAANKKK